MRYPEIDKMMTAQYCVLMMMQSRWMSCHSLWKEDELPFSLESEDPS